MAKERIPKGYRHRKLEESLRRSRLKTEARLFAESRSLGVPVPVIYDVDLEMDTLIMELVEGPTAKELLVKGEGDLESLCRSMGELAGRLHGGDVVHGDLTTSNMILREGRLYLIDFGLGERGADLEAKGVDLHLLREAFTSAHSEREELFQEVLRGYRSAYAGADEVIEKSEEIERRGRYLRGS